MRGQPRSAREVPVNKFIAAGIGLLLLLAAIVDAGTESRIMTNATTTAAGSGTAIFAGGCFWCMEPPFEKLDGVLAVTSGYTGGTVANPTYEQVSAGGTGHAEAVMITYDPAKLSYRQLLEVFWHNIDPTDGGGQFVDRGDQYRSAIFYQNEEERLLAEKSRDEVAASGRFKGKIVTEIVPAGPFYPAEGYHQDYYKHNPVRYQYYRWGSGRDAFLDRVWGKDHH
jgi:methionine-S-sulfoxide reductase